MIGSYIKTSGRIIIRNKLFSAVNIVGLAISLSVGLLLISVLKDLYSYDRFNENYSRIYRVIGRYQFLDNKDQRFTATTSLKAGKIIEQEFTGTEAVALLRRGFDGDMTFGEKSIPLSGLWANNAFFKVFTFPLLQGDATTALKMPYSVVLTETSARKIFGDHEPLGKSIILNDDKAYTITGIMKDVPRFSHMHFDMLASFATREITEKDNKSEMAWDNMWNVWVYVLMPENADLAAFQEGLNKMSAREDKTVKNTHIELRWQSLGTIMTGESLNNEIGTTMGSMLVFVFTMLTLVVLVSACFNYTNLSVARATRRTREIGIRKVIGALKAHVIGQFITEGVIISLMSLSLAFFLFLLVKPHFINMQPDLQELLVLDLSPALIVYFILFSILIGVIAGFFPALFFSKVNAIQVLKNVSNTRLFKKLTMRRVLIGFQYCLSIMLILGTIVIYDQYKYYLAYDLGYATKNILNIRLQGNKAELFKKELNEVPEVDGISASGVVMSVGNYWGTNIRNPNDPADSAFVHSNFVDENYLPLHEIHLLAGKNFTPRTEGSEESEVIVNQQLLKRFNLADRVPSQAIGEIIKVDGKELKIVGVMKDFHYGKASSEHAREVILRYSGKEIQYLNVKIAHDNLLEVYSKIENRWKRFDDTHSFDGKYYSDQIADSYSGISASMKLIGYIAFLTICISSLGLFGMVVFTTETRLKEISIRKVLGASEGKLVFLLGKGFMLLLVIAAGIALPTTYLFFDRVMFTRMGNHGPINFESGIVAVLLVIGTAIFMISTQTIKVARTNPADILKND